MSDGGSHLGRDGLLLDEEEVGFDGLHLLGLLVFGEERGVDVVWLGSVKLEGRGCGSLDHGESSDDISVGVLDLE